MSGTGEIKYLGDVQRLSLKPGDIVVLSTVINLTGEQSERLQEAVKRVIPNNEVMILCGGLKLGVLEAAA